MNHVWNTLSRGIDADLATQALKQTLIYANAHGSVLDLGAGQTQFDDLRTLETPLMSRINAQETDTQQNTSTDQE